MCYTLNSEEDVIALVRRAVNEIYDPCGLALGVSIGMSDMGLIRSIDAQRMEGGWGVSLRIRFTSPGCFYFIYFEREIHRRLGAFHQIGSITIEWDDALDWGPEDLSESARSKLRVLRGSLIRQGIS